MQGQNSQTGERGLLPKRQVQDANRATLAEWFQEGVPGISPNTLLYNLLRLFP
jgi:hypothetical protein